MSVAPEPAPAPASVDAIELAPFEPALAAALRGEAHGMTRAYVNALLAEIHRDSIVGIYAKGSAYRPWDSTIDYVPELSDVDIHVRLRPGAAHSLQSLGRVLDIARRALATFAALHPRRVHTPRPQLIPLARLEAEPGYRPSPAHSVHTLFGEPYAGAVRGQYDDVAAEDARRFEVDAHFVRSELPLKLIDRPGARAWEVVSRLTWRVAPAGPRLLTQLGEDPFDAWSSNRTGVVRRLCARGCEEIAEAYAAFYRAGWEGFHSGFQDGDVAGRASLAAERLFQLGSRRLSSRRRRRR